jgi:HAD superfamily hydrolase (TIGR01549 family)
MEPLVRGLRDAYERFGGVCPSDEEILATIGAPLRVQLTMFGLPEASPEELERRIVWTIERFEAHAELEREFEPAVDALELAFRAGYQVGLVTSKSQRELAFLLGRFRGAEWVHAAVCSSDVEHPKPHGESALLACRRLGVRPHETVLIGDSIFDIACARAAGVTAVAVAYGATPEAALAEARPDALFRTPEELRDWVADSALNQHAKKDFFIQNDRFRKGAEAAT